MPTFSSWTNQRRPGRCRGDSSVSRGGDTEIAGSDHPLHFTQDGGGLSSGRPYHRFRDGRHIATRDAKTMRPAEVIQLMVGRKIASLSVDHSVCPSEVVLQVENLSLPHALHPNRWQLDNVEFELRSGEVLGIAGLLGAGRTELLEALFGASDVTPTGTIRIKGSTVTLRSPSQAIDHGIAMVTEDRKQLGLLQSDVGGGEYHDLPLEGTDQGAFPSTRPGEKDR